MISLRKRYSPILYYYQSALRISHSEFRIPHAAFLVAVFLLFTICPADGQVRVNVTQNFYTVNEEMSLRAAIDGNLGQEGVDLYFALVVPGLDRLLFLGSDVQFHPEPVPAITNWTPFVVPEIPLVNYLFGGLEPEGDYYWCSAMFLSGIPPTSESLVGDVAAVRFNFTAPAVLDWFPRQGTVLNTTEPDLFLRFKKPVDTASVIERMEIQIESLSSGKIAEVKWIDGQRWVVLFLPDVGTVMQRVSANEYIRPVWTEGNQRLNLHVSSYTLYDMTYSLHFGGSYLVTFRLLNGAGFADGASIPEAVIGPFRFSIAGG